MPFEVVVTDRDIANGVASGPDCTVFGPISLAFQRLFPGFRFQVWLDEFILAWVDVFAGNETKRLLRVPLPDSAADFGYRFGYGMPVVPFSFHIEIEIKSDLATKRRKW